jgi:predicted secreted hydrolase
MKRWFWIAAGVLLLLLWSLYKPLSQKTTTALDLNSVLSEQTDHGFAKVNQPRAFSFPSDHAAHPEYRIEWWYLTGNLTAETGDEFGYQITFFRTALQSNPPQRQSNWASNQLWMAHLAVSDIKQQKHYQAQRLSRGALGLAGIQQQPFKIWLEDWQIVTAENGEFPWHIQAKDQQFSIDLTVSPLKPVVLQGEQGLSQKSAEPGNASYYYSFTRLQTSGTVSAADKEYQVNGLSWLDREWSSSALGKNQSGWDWFSLQLNNGEELMYYQLRDKAGNSHQHSQGKWVKTSGETINLTNKDIELKVIDYWHADTGKNYPISWKLHIPQLSQDLIIKAAIKDQLMRTSIRYWEGVVRVYHSNSLELIGQGYLEMTGYE